MNARVFSAGRWLLGLLFLVPGLIHAAAPYDYEAGKAWYYAYPSGGPYYSAYAAAQAGADSTLPGRTSGYCSYYGTPAYVYNVQPDAMYDAFNGHYSYNWGCGTTPISDSGGNLYRASCTVGTPACPAPPPDGCEQGKWHTVGGRAERFEDLMPEDMCIGTCMVTGSLGGPGMNKECVGSVCTWDWIGTAEQTGAQCPTAAPVPPPAPNPVPEDPEDGNPYNQNENCVLSESGFEICQNWDPQRADRNCGYYNDVFRCLDSLDRDECFVNEDGSRLCGDQAKPPTAPDNGTPGVPATPDDQIASDHNGQAAPVTNNYYNSTTVGGSSRPVTADGSNPARPGSNGPAGDDGGGDGTSDDSASGGADCSAPPSCDGDPIQCAVLEQSWRNRCEEMPTDAELLAAFGPSGLKEDGSFDSGEVTEKEAGDLDASGWLGGTACGLEDYSMNMGSLIGTYTVPFTELCGLMSMIAALVMVTAYVGAARIIIGGF